MVYPNIRGGLHLGLGPLPFLLPSLVAMSRLALTPSASSAHLSLSASPSAAALSSPASASASAVDPSGASAGAAQHATLLGRQVTALRQMLRLEDAGNESGPQVRMEISLNSCSFTYQRSLSLFPVCSFLWLRPCLRLRLPSGRCWCLTASGRTCWRPC